MTKKNTLNLNQIPVLCALVETKSVSGAAKRLGVANSVISYSLGALRTYYGDHLMVRTSDGMKPTSKALFLYDKYRAALELLELEGTTDNDFKISTNRIYRLRMNSLLEVWLVKNLIQDNPEFNHCTFDFIYPETTNEQRLSALRQKIVDIDVGTILERDHSILQYSGSLVGGVLVCRRDHPRITGEMVSREVLQNEQFIHWMSFMELSIQTVPLFYNEGLSALAIPYRSTNTLSLLAVVSSSEMISLLPEILADFYCKIFNLQVVKTDLNLSNHVAMTLHVHKEQLKNPVIAALCEMIRENFFNVPVANK